MMRKMDEEHIGHPEKGVIQMTDFLLDEGYKVGQRRVRRLMLKIDHRNQVWSIDITYIPMAKGFMYLTAIIDVYSRFIVGWSLHNTLDASNCIEVLKNAIAKYGAPEIINSDQGRQFTCQDWKGTCAEHPEMRISMDGRGRAKDNI